MRVLAVPLRSVPTIWLLSRRVSELLIELPVLILPLSPRFTELLPEPLPRMELPVLALEPLEVLVPRFT